MLVLGVILILVAAGALLAALVGASSQTVTFELGAFALEMTTIGAFLAGAATVLLLMIGVALVSSGVRGANRRRKEKKELKRRSKRLEAEEGGDRGTAASDGPHRTEPGGTGTTHPRDPGNGHGTH